LTHLLDTNIVIALLRNKPARVRERLRRAVSENASISVSSVVLFELRYGVARSERPEENAQRLRAFLSGNIGVLSFEDSDAAIAGDLRASLEASGTVIGSYDLFIAAQALRTGTTLATANVSEFSRVPGLTWQDWTLDE
jgi:tRNA(fMet)-specific endonuclease VapC